MSDDRFSRFETLLAEAAAKLQLPIENDRVRLLAALKMNHETLIERMMRGDTVPPNHVSELTTMIDAMLPVDAPPPVNVDIVYGVVGSYCCQHCNKWNHLKQGEFTPDAPVKPVNMIKIGVPKQRTHTADAPSALADVLDREVAALDRVDMNEEASPAADRTLVADAAVDPATLHLPNPHQRPP